MPLKIGDEIVHTAHASKQSKVGFWIFRAHTSVLVPILIIPVLPFPFVAKTACFSVLVLIFLERRGQTLSVAYKKIRARLAGRHRYGKTRHVMLRRIKNN